MISRKISVEEKNLTFTHRGFEASLWAFAARGKKFPTRRGDQVNFLVVHIAFSGRNRVRPDFLDILTFCRMCLILIQQNLA